MNNNHPPYSLIWKMLGKDDPLAERFWVPGYSGYLPFFVFEDQIDRSHGMSFMPDEKKLLLGICYGSHGYFYEPGSYPSLTKHDMDTYHYLFGMFAQGFQFPNPEEAFCTMGNYLQKQLKEPWASIVLLETGLKFLDLHHNTAIKSNLCIEYWQAIDQTSNETARAELLNAVIDTLATLDDKLNLTFPNAYIGFLGMQAASMRKDPDTVAALYKKFEPYMTPEIRQLADKVLSAPDKFEWMAESEVLKIVEDA